MVAVLKHPPTPWGFRVLSQDGWCGTWCWHLPVSCSMLVVAVCQIVVAGVWVVDTPAPQGVGCVRFASGGGRLVSVVVCARRFACLWLGSASGWLLVCAGCASLNPRGGLRLVPHGGGWVWWLVGGGAARRHTPTTGFLCGQQGVVVVSGVRRWALMWGSLSCDWCGRVVGIETWVSVSARGGHANDNAALRATGLGGGFRPAAGVCFRWWPTGKPSGQTPKAARGRAPPVSNPLGRPPKSAGRGGRGGAPGRAATTVSAQAPNGLNQPSWRTHRMRLPPRSNPRWNTTEENPKKHPQQTRPNNPTVGVKTRRNINPVSAPFQSPAPSPHSEHQPPKRPRLPQPQHHPVARCPSLNAGVCRRARTPHPGCES